MESMSMDENREQLRLLGLFYQIMGGIAWGVAFLLLYLLQRTSAPYNMVLILWATIMGIGLGLMIAGRRMKRCLNYVFCISMATFACFFFPFGTILGILTFVVFSRPHVKRLFRS